MELIEFMIPVFRGCKEEKVVVHMWFQSCLYILYQNILCKTPWYDEQ